MGITLSTRWTRFNTYRFLARNLITPIIEIIFQKEAFCGLPGTRLSKLKSLHENKRSGAEQLDLTEEEWEQLFDFLVPTLTQLEEKV